MSYIIKNDNGISILTGTNSSQPLAEGWIDLSVDLSKNDPGYGRIGYDKNYFDAKSDGTIRIWTSDGSTSKTRVLYSSGGATINPDNEDYDFRIDGTVSTIFRTDALNGRVGILTNPQTDFHVNGLVRFSSLPTSPQSGYVLQSINTSGDLDWLDISTLSTDGNGIYDGNGTLSGDTTVTMHGNTSTDTLIFEDSNNNDIFKIKGNAAAIFEGDTTVNGDNFTRKDMEVLGTSFLSTTGTTTATIRQISIPIGVSRLKITVLGQRQDLAGSGNYDTWHTQETYLSVTYEGGLFTPTIRSNSTLYISRNSTTSVTFTLGFSSINVRVTGLTGEDWSWRCDVEIRSY